MIGSLLAAVLVATVPPPTPPTGMIPWPEVFASGDACTSDVATGSLTVADYDNDAIVVRVPIVCAEGAWYIPVTDSLPDEARLVALACLDELAALEPGPECEDITRRLTLESDPAAFIVRRQLQVMTVQISMTQYQIAVDPAWVIPEEFTEQVIALIDMLRWYVTATDDEALTPSTTR